MLPHAHVVPNPNCTNENPATWYATAFFNGCGVCECFSFGYSYAEALKRVRAFNRKQKRKARKAKR